MARSHRGGVTLRAPDVAVNFEDAGGTWATKAPLALEYAGRGQDEADLRAKIAELLARDVTNDTLTA